MGVWRGSRRTTRITQDHAPAKPKSAMPIFENHKPKLGRITRTGYQTVHDARSWQVSRTVMVRIEMLVLAQLPDRAALRPSFVCASHTQHYQFRLTLPDDFNCDKMFGVLLNCEVCVTTIPFVLSQYMPVCTVFLVGYGSLTTSMPTTSCLCNFLVLWSGNNILLSCNQCRVHSTPCVPRLPCAPYLRSRGACRVRTLRPACQNTRHPPCVYQTWCLIPKSLIGIIVHWLQRAIRTLEYVMICSGFVLGHVQKYQHMIHLTTLKCSSDR